MAFNAHTTNFSQHRSDARPQPAGQIDILEWYQFFQSCHKYFLDVAQHSEPVKALAAFMNIRLPHQRAQCPGGTASGANAPHGDLAGPHLRQPNIYSAEHNAMHAEAVSLIPYIRRLVATGNDTVGILHGFFGDDWVRGVGALHEIERRNYLFAAKSTSWMKVKQAYDMSVDETIPFLSPLKDATEKEIQNAENTWSEWLAMQDWMIGPRAPDAMNRPRVKREPREQ